MKKFWNFKFLSVVFLMLTFFIVCLVFYCNYQVEKNAEGKTYSTLSTIPYNKVGLLLGTCKTLKDKKTINPFWKNRLDAAYILWKSNKIKYILVSGDNGWHGYNEPLDFKEALMALGVPDSCIVCDFAGFRTFDSMIRCKEIFGQKSVTVISQQFHNERALYIAKENDINAIGFNAKDVSFKDGLRNFYREKAARVLMFLDFLFHTQPHFLGKPEFIK